MTEYTYTDDAEQARSIPWGRTGYDPRIDLEDFTVEIEDEHPVDESLSALTEPQFDRPNVERYELTTTFRIGTHTFTRTRTVWRVIR